MRIRLVLLLLLVFRFGADDVDDDIDVDIDEGDDDMGLGLGADQPVEAYTINSPKDISDLWHKAIMDQRKRGEKLDLQPGGDMYKRARKEANERLSVRTSAQKRAMAHPAFTKDGQHLLLLSPRDRRYAT